MKHLAITSLLLAALLAALLASAASADTITFGGAAEGPFAGSVIEGDFRYSLFGGGLFIDGGSPTIAGARAAV